MARQWFLPSPGGGMIDEDGAEEYFVPTVGMINEDQATDSPEEDAGLFTVGQHQPRFDPPEVIGY